MRYGTNCFKNFVFELKINIVFVFSVMRPAETFFNKNVDKKQQSMDNRGVIYKEAI